MVVLKLEYPERGHLEMLQFEEYIPTLHRSGCQITRPSWLGVIAAEAASDGQFSLRHSSYWTDYIEPVGSSQVLITLPHN